MLGMESFVHLEKRDLKKVCIRTPKFPYYFLEQEYQRELSKLNRLSFPSSES